MAYSNTTERTFLGMKLWQQVLLGLVLGIATGFALKFYGPSLGLDVNDAAEKIKTLGVVFIKLIKMVVAPLILFALISGITSLTGSNDFSRIGLKGAGAYLATACLAVIFGLTIATIDQPGKHIDREAVAGSMGVPEATKTASGEPASIGTFLLDLIPANIFNAMAEDHYLQIVVFAIFTGIVMIRVGDKAKNAKIIIDEFAQIAFRMIEWIVMLAPIAIFSFMSWMVATMGMDALMTLMELVVLVIVACFLQYLFFGVLIIIFARVNPIPFYKKMFTTQIMAFSTSSSKATLSTAMRELQDKLGVSESTTKFMMPLGASINMDGTAIYLGICAVFFAQFYGVELTMQDYLLLVITCTLGSIGAAGIPSGSIIFMGMVLHSVGLPLEGIGIILGIDRILDMFRTTINITGDAAITLIIDRTEGKTDMSIYNAKE